MHGRDNNKKSRKLPHKQEFLIKAKENNNEVFDLSIIKSQDSNNINCGDLGKILELLQNTIYSLALDKDSNTKNISEEIKRKSELFYSDTSFYPFFTISLVSNISELFEKDKSKIYCNSFIEILRYTDNSETIIENMQKYNLLTKIRFRNFIKLLVTNSLEVNVRWANNHGSYNDVSITYNKLKSSLEALEGQNKNDPNTLTYKGELVGINVKNDFFALITNENNFIKGKLSKVMKNKKFKVLSNVIAEIEEHAKICDLTKEIKKYYTLKNIVSEKIIRTPIKYWHKNTDKRSACSKSIESDPFDFYHKRYD